MHEQFGEWYRVAKIQPEHELLERRWSGVEAFASAAAEADVFDLSRLFNALPVRREGFLPDFRTAFQEADAAFPMKGNDLELAVLAGASLSRLSSSSNPKPQAVVAAMSAVMPSLQGNRGCGAVPEIGEEVRNRLRNWSLGLRGRPVEKRISSLGISEVRKELEEKLATNAAPQYSPSLLKLMDSITNRVSQIATKVNTIEQRQVLYHEDSDILWWFTAMHSRDLGPLADLPICVAAIVSGKELADLTHVVPGPLAARAVLTRVISMLADGGTPKISVSECVNLTDREWRARLERSLNPELPRDLCPILSAIAKSLETEGEKEWYPSYHSFTGVEAEMQLSAADLAVQVYEESLLGRVLGKESGGAQ